MIQLFANLFSQQINWKRRVFYVWYASFRTQRRQSDTFDNFTRNFFRSSNASLPAFRTDIRDQGDKFLLEAELPGFQKEDISLELKEGILTIKAEHKENQDQKDDKGNYIRRERRYGSFSRTFDVSGIDENAITAVYNNGILELTLPKLAPVVPQSRQIAIG